MILWKEKVIQWKYVLLNTKLFWLNENIFSYHMNFYFCNISATIYNLIGVHFWGVLQPVGHVVGQKDKCRPIRTQEIAVVRLYKKLFDKNRVFLGQRQHAYDFSNLRHILIKICIK